MRARCKRAAGQAAIKSLLLAAFLCIPGYGRAASPNPVRRGSDWAAAAFGEQGSAPGSGAVTADDLLHLRDFGGLSLSPNGRWLAFAVHEAVLDRNVYKVRWFVVPTDGTSLPTPLSQDGGQPIFGHSYGLPLAVIGPEAAQWSPDSRRIAFRRREDHRIELWTADVATRQARRVSDGEAQIDNFTWSRSGALIFRTGLQYGRYLDNLKGEATHGYLLDHRIPLFASHMWPTEPDCGGNDPDLACDIRTFTFNVKGVVHPASAADVVILDDTLKQKALVATRTDGATLSADPIDPTKSNAFKPLRRLTMKADRRTSCPTAECVGAWFSQVGWVGYGASAWFLKAESGAGRADGAPMDETGLYEWWPQTGVVRTVVRSAAILSDCHVVSASAYCTRESERQPAQIVAIDLNTSTSRILADPNPTFSTKVFPKIEKIKLDDPQGGTGFADLVYPNAYQAGQTYPLVVVTYRSRGFLRGGVGNEYPIYPLAAAGFFVLSVNLPEPYDAYQTINLMADNRLKYDEHVGEAPRGMAAIDLAIDSLVARRLVDPGKLAITGLSSGAELTHYILQHSSRFSAAIASSGAPDLSSLSLVPDGPSRSALMEIYRSTSVVASPQSQLQRAGWSTQPEKLRTPLLINVGEYEAMVGFEGFAALNFAKRPLEVRVFPDEQHVKYHPQSIAGVFDNNLRWLKFWLLNEEDIGAPLRTQYRRWELMRINLKSDAQIATK